MVKTRYNELIGALGDVLESPDIAPDENNFLVLRFDGGTVLFMELDSDTRRIRLQAGVWDCPGELPPGLGRMLCSANLHWQGTGGARLGLDRESGSITLQHDAHIDALDGESFAQTVETLLNLAEHWQGEIKAFLDGENPDDDGQPIEIPCNAIRI